MAGEVGGYARDMRFKLGFVAGFAAGYWMGKTPVEERRARFDQMVAGVRDNPRVQRVTDTVSKDAKRLGDAVEQRLVASTDTAVNAVAGTVEPGRSSATGSAPSGTMGSPATTGSSGTTASSGTTGPSATPGSPNTRRTA